MDGNEGSMPPLGDVELEALKALWDAGPSTVRQVAEALRARGRLARPPLCACTSGWR